MARPIKNKKSGVTVKINHDTSEKVIQIIDKSKRSFSAEVNVGVEEYADKKIQEYKSNGR